MKSPGRFKDAPGTESPFSTREPVTTISSSPWATAHNGVRQSNAAAMGMFMVFMTFLRLLMVGRSYFDDELDLDARPHRQLGDAECAAGMRAAFPEHRDEELRATVRDQVLLGEIAGRIDEAQRLHDTLDLVEAAERILKRREQIERNRVRRGLAVGGRHVPAELPGPWPAVLARDVPGDEQEIAGSRRHDEGRNGLDRRG